MLVYRFSDAADTNNAQTKIVTKNTHILWVTANNPNTAVMWAIRWCRYYGQKFKFRINSEKPDLERPVGPTLFRAQYSHNRGNQFLLHVWNVTMRNDITGNQVMLESPGRNQGEAIFLVRNHFVKIINHNQFTHFKAERLINYEYEQTRS